MKLIYLSIGSNLCDPAIRVKEALCEISSLKCIERFEPSRLYITSPKYIINQPNFVNAACSFYTNVEPHTLFELLEEIERKVGKRAKPKNYPRVVDIDFLLYGDQVINTKKLIVPHPMMLERLFVLVPLSDLAATIEYPGSSCGAIDLVKKIEELKKSTNDQYKILL